MNKAKSAALIIVLSLIVTVFGGCQPGGSSQKDKAVDLGGYEFTILSPFISGLVLDDISPEVVKIYDKRKKEVEEKYNCKIKGLRADPGMDYIMPKILSGEKIADVIDMTPSQWIPAAKAGYLTKWTDVPNVDLTDARWTAMGMGTGNLDGDQWGINWLRPTELRGCMFFNKTMMQTNNIEDIYKLVDEKKWTFDKFREIAKACTKDTDNDGVMNTYGVGYLFDTRLNDYFVAANNTKLLKTDNGKTVTNFTSQNLSDALEFLYKITRVDKIVDIAPANLETPPKEAIPSTDYAINNFIEGKTAFLVADSWVAGQKLANTMKDEYGLIPLPIGPDADDYVSLANDGRVFVTTSTNKDLDKTGTIWSALALLDEDHQGDQWWLDDIRITDYCDDESIENYKMLLGKSTIDPGLCVSEFYFKYTHEVVKPSIFFNTTTPGAALDSIKGKYQEMIDAVFNSK